jgi:hypothetical protein
MSSKHANRRYLLKQASKFSSSNIRPSTFKKINCADKECELLDDMTPSDHVSLAIVNADGTTYDFEFSQEAGQDLDLKLMLRNAAGTYDYIYTRDAPQPDPVPVPVIPSKHFPVVNIKNNTNYYCKITPTAGAAVVLSPLEQSESVTYVNCTVKFFKFLTDAENENGLPDIQWTICNTVTDDSNPYFTKCTTSAINSLTNECHPIAVNLTAVDGVMTAKDTLAWSYKSGTVGTVTCDFHL